MENQGQHLRTLPPELQKKIQDRWQVMTTGQQRGELPSFPEFVDVLFKRLRTPVDTLHHAATGISGEAGEALDASKKEWAYNKPLDFENMVEELCDLRFYYQAMLNLLGITDQEVQAFNMHKLYRRFPGGVYSDKAAQERKDKDGEV